MTGVDLHAVLSDVESLLRHSLPANVTIRLKKNCEHALIWGNSPQLQQALLNLAVNAQQAMPSGGILEFELSDGIAPSTALMSDMESPERVQWVCLRVRDTGIGMTESVRKQIFEPFFTTRSHGHGTGLGLATVYGIIEAHHGKIQVDSIPNRGTTFSLYFPARNDLQFPVEKEPADMQSSARSCRILLVEDEASVAEVTAQMLASLGHEVTTADRPSRALQLTAHQAVPFDLLITDLTMPEMSGKDLAERLRARWPQLPVLLISGYDFQHDAATWAISLSKPLTLASLRRGVEQAMGSAQAVSSDAAAVSR
jgi:CheY-like chemotaxis protein